MQININKARMINSLSTVSTDMPKTFDSLHGFKERLVQHLNSCYLCDKYNRIKMGKGVSLYRLVNRGCPQGSALGPFILWNIFQNVC